jgi:hypothetical protein
MRPPQFARPELETVGNWPEERDFLKDIFYRTNPAEPLIKARKAAWSILGGSKVLDRPAASRPAR